MNFAGYNNRRTKLYTWLIGLVPLRTGSSIVRLKKLLSKHFNAINDKNDIISVHVHKLFMSLQDCRS